MHDKRFGHIFRAGRDKATLTPNQGRQGDFIKAEPKSNYARVEIEHAIVAISFAQGAGEYNLARSLARLRPGLAIVSARLVLRNFGRRQGCFKGE